MKRGRQTYIKPTPCRAPRRRRDGKARAIRIGAAVGIGAVAVLAGCWWTMWRPIEVTVNDKPVTVSVGTNAEALLTEHDYFGAKPGRLLSISGNVLDETGGARCDFVLGAGLVPAEELSETKLAEGMYIDVQDGADITEPYTEETVDALPAVVFDGTGAIQYVTQKGAAGLNAVRTGKQSGEEVVSQVVNKPVDTIVSRRTPAPQEKKCIALTFDDGPSVYTPEILDILKDKRAKATFFNLGTQAARYPEYAKRVVDEGHEMASHTNSHQYLPDLSRDDLRADITSSFDAIEKACGQRPTMIRAPYGAFDEACWGNAGDLIASNVLWNIDTLDWKMPGAGAIKAAVLGNAFNGAIVLMHDGGGDRTQDIEALPGIIDGLHDAGYELVTVGELMELDGSF